MPITLFARSHLHISDLDDTHIIAISQHQAIVRHMRCGEHAIHTRVVVHAYRVYACVCDSYHLYVCVASSVYVPMCVWRCVSIIDLIAVVDVGVGAAGRWVEVCFDVLGLKTNNLMVL